MKKNDKIIFDWNGTLATGSVKAVGKKEGRREDQILASGDGPHSHISMWVYIKTGTVLADTPENRIRMRKRMHPPKPTEMDAGTQFKIFDRVAARIGDIPREDLEEHALEYLMDLIEVETRITVNENIDRETQ